ncbi:MAG: hypothetical protein C0169_07060, partial [Thermodesulfobacterium geofontis]
MKSLKILTYLLILIPFLMFFNLKSSYGKDVDMGFSIDNGKISHFYLSIGDYYRVPVEKIIIIKKRYPFIIEEEIPIIFFISEYRGIDPDVIISLRSRGYSWYNIMIHFGLYPERIFERYIIYGPPYGKAWGYYKPYKKKKVIVFRDRDIIELANVK